MVIDVITVVILCWLISKIFINLYNCTCNIICYPVFSNKHTWIVEPSPLNKIYAFLSLIAMIISYLSDELLAFSKSSGLLLTSDLKYYFGIIPDTFMDLSHLFYLLYLVSVVEYQSKASSEFKRAIPNTIPIIIKIFRWIVFLSTICVVLYWKFDHHQIFYAGEVDLIAVVTVAIIDLILYIWRLLEGWNEFKMSWMLTVITTYLFIIYHHMSYIMLSFW